MNIKYIRFICAAALLLCLTACDSIPNPPAVTEPWPEDTEAIEQTTAATTQGCNHYFGDWKVKKRATCQEEGLEVRTCRHCGYELTATIPRGYHTIELLRTVKPTCTEDGMEEYGCSVCKTVTKQDILPALGHDVSSWRKVSADNCSTMGYQTGNCIRCRQSITEETTVGNHHFVTWVPLQAATCTSSGSERSVCAVCGIESIRITEPLPHSVPSWQTLHAATCHEIGVKTGICRTCGKEQTQDIAMLAHIRNAKNFCSLCNDPLPSEGLSYTSSAVGITISGIGTCKDRDVHIPAEIDGKPVIGIARDAFRNNTTITSVIIPDSVTTMNTYAFYGCTSLQEVTLSSSLVNVDSYSFYGCTALREIVLPDGIDLIGYSAFNGCTALESCNIPSSVKEIGAYAFSNCKKLEGLTLPDSLQILNNYSLQNVPMKKTAYLGAEYIGSKKNPYMVLMSVPDRTITNLTIHPDTRFIESNSARNLTMLTSITVPDKVISIGNYAFQSCSAVTEIHLPDSLKTIGSGAFQRNTSLTYLEIPSGVTSIGSNIISYCDSLLTLTVNPANNTFYNLDNCIIQTSNGTLIAGCNNSTIPQDGSIKSIGSYAFAGMTKLKSVTIPSSVTRIQNYAFEGCELLTSMVIPRSVTYIGTPIFGGCDNLTRLTVEAGNTTYTSAGNCIIRKSDKTLVSACMGSVIPSDGSVKAIAGWAFDGLAIKHMTIPSGITEIPQCAFQSCNQLVSVSIPKSVVSIASGAFNGCNALTTVNYAGSSADWNRISKHSNNSGLNKATVKYNSYS